MLNLEYWKRKDFIWWRSDIPEWNQPHPLPDLMGDDGKLRFSTLNKHRDRTQNYTCVSCGHEWTGDYISFRLNACPECTQGIIRYSGVHK